MESHTLENLCEKELSTKKSILEHIEMVRKISIDTFESQQWQEIYNYIYVNIEKQKEKVKPNTVHFLKNALKAALAKRVEELEPIEEDPFIMFLKEAYPEKERGKDFLFALADHTKMRDDQILTTLKYISNEMQDGYCMDSRVRTAVKDKIGLLVDRRNIKALKQIKSLEGLRTDGELGKYIKKISLS
jgi:hypothetical protein